MYPVYADWSPPHLGMVVCYVFHLLMPLLCRIWFYRDCNGGCKGPVLDVMRTLGTSGRAICCGLLGIYFSSLVDLDTLMMMSPGMDAPYLWIRPLDLVPLGLACGLLYIIMGRLCIPVITLHLSIVAKRHSVAAIARLWRLGLLAAGTPLLHMLCYMNWLTHSFWTRTGGWEFDRPHGAGTSSPSHWQQVEEQAPKPVGWIMCFLLMTFVPVQKLCIYIYIYIYALLYEFCFLWFTNCVLLSDDNSLIPGCLWLLAFVLNNTLILGISLTSQDVSVPGPSFIISDSTWCHRTPLCYI